jgi:hypothetical protein
LWKVQEGDVGPVEASEEGVVTLEVPESQLTAVVDATLEVPAEGDPLVDSTSELPPPEDPVFLDAAYSSVAAVEQATE